MDNLFDIWKQYLQKTDNTSETKYSTIGAMVDETEFNKVFGFSPLYILQCAVENPYINLDKKYVIWYCNIDVWGIFGSGNTIMDAICDMANNQFDSEYKPYLEKTIDGFEKYLAKRAEEDYTRKNKKQESDLL